MLVDSRHATRHLASCMAALALVACSFPDFVVLPGAAGQSGGGGSGLGAEAGQSSGGGGLVAAGGGGGEGGEGGEGPCGAPEVPVHCSNDTQDVDETDVDCGGPSCEPCGADEACTADSDCATGSCNADRCNRLFDLSYVQQEPDEETGDFLMHVLLTYLGSELVALSDISVRYYFSRNSVAEPILPGNSLATTLPNGANAGDDLALSVVRQLRGDGLSNDAYFEMAFTGGKVLGAGESVDLQLDVDSGGGDNRFTQRTHHSFDPLLQLHESKKLTVHVKGVRVWGRGPVVDEPRSCFYQGVNLGGKAVTIDGQAWLPGPASTLPEYAIEDQSVQPDTDTEREAMLRGGFGLRDAVFSYPVANGHYSVLAYVWSEPNINEGVLTVQGEPRDRFIPRSYEGGSAWSPLGPYRVTVANGQLDLGATGYLSLGGFELRLLDE